MHVHRQVLAAAERAADARLQADLLGSQPEGRADLALVDVQPLGRDVVDAAGAVGDGEPGLGPRNAWSCMPTW